MIQLLLDTTDYHLVLVGGEAEGDRLVRLAALIPAARGKMLRHKPLAELAQNLADCRAFIGHDSGITHLAAAVGVPAWCCGATQMEEVWRPQGEKVRIIRAANGLVGITPEQVVITLTNLPQSRQ